MPVTLSAINKSRRVLISNHTLRVSSTLDEDTSQTRYIDQPLDLVPRSVLWTRQTLQNGTKEY
ncbi:hypothetical protein PGT21_011380 [Puccinia graminis f. sp. tritici]|uniref:Uncharacterized protein n=1 Tax=Puccinia graminis f. sp. tritici TaxID=56615 RepID=A0A5B0QUH7_PUCGR|nr:hypothetical protein PGTUg99_022326 [Puccinia graminis f. sp. tritici]KAA1116374.1 hypothetical protein PGT21_011380 [Puccinia graminis f. sp. tritici]